MLLGSLSMKYEVDEMHIYIISVYLIDIMQLFNSDFLNLMIQFSSWVLLFDIFTEHYNVYILLCFLC